MLSRSFSSEKSYSPSRLRCCQATAEPWATASRNASRLAVSLISSNLRKVEIIPANDAVFDDQLAGFRQAGLPRPAAKRRGGEVKILLALETVENWRRVESLTFDRVENIHPGHERSPG